MLTKYSLRPAPGGVFWWSTDLLDEAVALDTALRMMKRFFQPVHRRDVHWHLRLWLGLAETLKRSATNARRFGVRLFFITGIQ